jgi:hypothetical protein
MRQRLKTTAFAAIAAALAVAGMAVAAGNDDGDSNEKGTTRHADRLIGPGPGGPGLREGRDLTYSESHLREDGKDVTVRVDHGKVTATDSDSIEIERNDGETLDIPVNDDTDVFAGPRKRDANVEDIAVGKQVMVMRKSGSDAAELVGVIPKHPPLVRFHGGPRDGDHFGPGDMPPPPMDGDR